MTLKYELSICLAKLKAIEKGLQKEAERADNAEDARIYRDAMRMISDIREDTKKRLETLG